MPAYVIVNVGVLDQEAGMAYAPVAQKSILSHGGRYLVAGPTPEPVEGDWNSSRFLVIEFPDMDRIRTWYDSPEYRQAREIREGKVEMGMLFVEGSPPEGFSLPAQPMAVTGQAGTARSSASAGRSLIMSIGAEQREASVQALDDLLRASALVRVLVNVGP